MKNVAKCDTWCELQNPVNHRVFERKLRPRPPGRGHACLGVTRTSHSGARARARPDAETGPPPRGGPKTGARPPPARGGARRALDRRRAEFPRSSRPLRAGERRPARHQRMTRAAARRAGMTSHLRRPSRRDPRSGGATR
ncbi:hypothetical protein IHE45_20G011700 [Dioscorea alata]|uniref:Uncharacterized protein n=1 Tax=Dioscorea alata TaxID=55571 RepID=A0ACB7TSD8_DIOAL|nr:hypothetical protein IHE45_20G011700 [Dioscorea alata]